MANSLASILYPEKHTSAKKREKALTAPVGGSTKVTQQQKPATKSTKAPQNAAKK